MSRRTSPAIIGAFVVGAVILATIAVLVFGGSRFFQEKRYFITYFDGTVTGLRVGSNVLFRGVRVGYVTDIGILADASLDRFTVPVTYQILPDAFAVLGEGDGEAHRVDIRELIDRGLRAKMEVESYVTGQLIVQLDFYPDQSVKAERYPDAPYPEIPSVPSGIQQALANVQEFISELQESVDIRQLATDLQEGAAGLNRLVNSPELASAIAGIDRLVNDGDAQALPGSARRTLAAVEDAAGAAAAMLERGDAELGPLLGESRETLAALADAAAEAGRLLEATRLQMGTDGGGPSQLGETLRELESAARSLRVLTDYLERHPEALLRGKRERR